jgi:hypothetical protein
MRRRPEDVASVVNGVIVLLLPVGLAVAAWMDLGRTHDGQTTVIASPTMHVLSNLTELAALVTVFLPLALVAAWRTWVHARRYVAEEAAGWQGVAEAGAVGFSIALLILSPGILTRPTEAPPYIIAYGGIALLVGLALGVILRTTAILVLIFSRTNRS